jgi:hypothetical protein
VAHVIDGDRQAQQQRLVLADADLDTVGVAHPEPLLRNGRDDVVALDLVLVIDDVAVRAEVLAVLNLDPEAVADPDDRLVDRRGASASPSSSPFVAQTLGARSSP